MSPRPAAAESRRMSCPRRSRFSGMRTRMSSAVELHGVAGCRVAPESTRRRPEASARRLRHGHRRRHDRRRRDGLLPLADDGDAVVRPDRCAVAVQRGEDAVHLDAALLDRGRARDRRARHLPGHVEIEIDLEARQVVADEAEAPRLGVHLDVAEGQPAQAEDAADLQRIAFLVEHPEVVDLHPARLERDARREIAVAPAGRRHGEGAAVQGHAAVEQRVVGGAGDAQLHRRGPGHLLDGRRQAGDDLEADRRALDVEVDRGRAAAGRTGVGGARLAAREQRQRDAAVDRHRDARAPARRRRRRRGAGRRSGRRRRRARTAARDSGRARWRTSPARPASPRCR